MADEITSQLRPQLLGRMTQRAVVEALKAHGPMSRADIARITGISPTTVSSAVVQVLKAGYVEETVAAASGPGRPGRILRFANDGVQVLGISVEPDSCEMVVGGLDGTPLPRKHYRFPTPNTYPSLLAEIERHARRWMDSKNVRTLGVGLSLPGLLDPTGERAAFSPNFHQTDDEQPGHDLAERLGLPTVLIQESDALSLAEQRVLQTNDLAIIDYTGGLGVSRLLGGRLSNRNLGQPTELGHVTVQPGGHKCGCGNRGCLETLATDAAFARLVSEKLKRPLTIDEAITAAKQGKADFTAEIETVLDALAIAVAAVKNLYAPPLIILHGRMLTLHADLVAQLHEKAKARMLAPFRDGCKLVTSQTRKADGALMAILDYLFEELGPRLPTAQTV